MEATHGSVSAELDRYDTAPWATSLPFASQLWR